MNIMVKQVFLVIPAEHVTHARNHLCAQPSLADRVPDALARSESAQLLALLQQRHWLGQAAADGSLTLTDYQGPALDRERDPMLALLLRVAQAGSVLQGFEPRSGQWWQLTWLPGEPRWIKGQVHFPLPARCTRSQQTLVRVRHAQEADLAALREVSERPVLWQDGLVLLIERECALAFLQYHVSPHERDEAVITRLSLRPNGWTHGGYPQHLIAVLQGRFHRLWVVPALKAHRQRHWLRLGFMAVGSQLCWSREDAPAASSLRHPSDASLPAL